MKAIALGKSRHADSHALKINYLWFVLGSSLICLSSEAYGVNNKATSRYGCHGIKAPRVIYEIFCK